MRVLGIMRGSRYSVNMAGLDAAILQAVVERLRRKGFTVDIIPESDMLSTGLERYDLVLSMARDITALSQFRTTLPCLNTTEGILACSRKALVAQVFQRAGIPQPAFSLGESPKVRFPLWVKRGSGCSEEKSDTAYVSNEAELKAAIATLRERGITECLLQEHVEGDLVKFYGVEGTPFFHWLYADGTHSKFGLERLNGKHKGYAFSPLALKAIADKAARQLGVQIYGGDCIVDQRGQLNIIDFNDWPSFYCCQGKAAEAIVERTTNAMTKQ
ncbi:MAG: hypothetical protein LUB62_02655 [Prevotellaceae bacterium]|nr:hypothetical protein [Prevotellaceae bacterium]